MGAVVRVKPTFGGHPTFVLSFSLREPLDELRRAVREHLGLDENEQCIVFQGKVLHGNLPLQEYGIAEGATVFVCSRPTRATLFVTTEQGDMQADSDADVGTCSNSNGTGSGSGTAYTPDLDNVVANIAQSLGVACDMRPEGSVSRETVANDMHAVLRSLNQLHAEAGFVTPTPTPGESHLCPPSPIPNPESPSPGPSPRSARTSTSPTPTIPFQRPTSVPRIDINRIQHSLESLSTIFTSPSPTVPSPPAASPSGCPAVVSSPTSSRNSSGLSLFGQRTVEIANDLQHVGNALQVLQQRFKKLSAELTNQPDSDPVPAGNLGPAVEQTSVLLSMLGTSLTMEGSPTSRSSRVVGRTGADSQQGTLSVYATRVRTMPSHDALLSPRKKKQSTGTSMFPSSVAEAAPCSMEADASSPAAAGGGCGVRDARGDCCGHKRPAEGSDRMDTDTDAGDRGAAPR
eukprot:TRINITY_DN15065_c0_g1_i2.p1 TRINITY_DN15065_c0_g1~~TRINITY_DN15065_c0_g1_i2.p1  ORF type:complete len:459 (-),score=59.54 TRINITY_DN15065_c0_g1_i2:64-1440(-)